MIIISSGKTNQGRVRTNNEDSFVVDDAAGLYAVADGIGGHQGGEVASRLAVDTLSETLRARLAAGFANHSSPDGEAPCLTTLADAFLAANTRIRGTAAESPGLSGMGTTMTALFLQGNKVCVAHVGDSRAYRFRDGRLAQVTDDHTVVADQTRAGLITYEQARQSPYRHIITRALGLDPSLDVDRLLMDLRTGDRFLLCSDGLTEMVGDREIAAVLSSAPPAAATEQLVSLALEHGGIDNVTVVVVATEEGA